MYRSEEYTSAMTLLKWDEPDQYKAIMDHVRLLQETIYFVDPHGKHFSERVMEYIKHKEENL